MAGANPTLLAQLSLEYFSLVVVLLAFAAFMSHVIVNLGFTLSGTGLDLSTSAESLSYMAYYDSLSLGPYVAGEKAIPVVCDANGCRYANSSTNLKAYYVRRLRWYR